MCDVCVATEVLRAGKEGHEVGWKGHPVTVRATGKGPEFKPARFQIRRPGGRWSKPERTDDLASVMVFYGFDVKWRYVKSSVKRWLRGEAQRPKVPAYPSSETAWPRTGG